MSDLIWSDLDAIYEVEVTCIMFGVWHYSLDSVGRIWNSA